MSRAWFVAALLMFAAGCAAKAPPPLPAAPAFPDFMFPAIPSQLQGPSAALVDRGWRYLQNKDFGNAEREFAAALKRTPALYPARAGSAYVALAQGEVNEALAEFDAALKAAPAYAPALVGRGQSLLAAKREAEALAAFEAALAADPSLTDLTRRIQVLQFRSLQDVIEGARAAAAAGRVQEARDAYNRALSASPDSAFLHRELALLERTHGNPAGALEHFRRASELDPADAVSFTQIGEILEQRQDLAGAATAYRAAAAIEPSPELDRRMAAIAERTRDAALPQEFRALASAAEITRGDLAALFGVRLEPVLRAAPVREVVITDTRGHWAAPWITAVARAGVIPPFENHTFQPRARLRRVDLATAVSRVLALMADTRPALRARLAERPAISDMASGHLSFPDVAAAVASGVVPLLEGNRFQMTRPVSGAEAIDAVNRLLALAASL